jgi:hypothetical protein
MDSTFLDSLLTVCSLFRLQLQLSFEFINFFKKEDQRLLSGSIFGFISSLVVFLQFKFGDCSSISRAVVILATIVTPHVGPLMILRRLAYTTGNRFLIIYW